MNLKQFAAVLIFFFANVSFAYAASLYLDPAHGIYGEGDTFSIKVRADVEEECVNAFNVTLDYPSDLIKAVDVARGESILTLWTEEPEINHSNGTIHFSGGLPGGYCGRLKGDPKFTNVVAEVIFQVSGLAIEAGTGEIAFTNDTEVFLNDGFGTKAQLYLNDATFIIGPPQKDDILNEWFNIVRNDDIKPESFSIELLRNESVYSGKWFIVYSTLDKQSGLDYFEVYETDIEREGYVRGKKNNEESLWIEGRSPYLLQDQTLNSIIRVRAVDKAGNERLAEKIPEESLRSKTQAPINKNLFYISLIGVLVVLVVLFIFRETRKRKQRRHATIGNNEVFDEQGSTPSPSNTGEEDV